MIAKNKLPDLSVAICCCAVWLTACTYSRPLQTGFYCIDIPEGRSAEANLFLKKVAGQLNFSISEAQYAFQKGPPNHVWEVYGQGTSMFVSTAMKDGKPDRSGNVETTFNPNRLGFNVVRTGWLQRFPFDKVVSAARDIAGQLGWQFSKAASGRGCAT